MEFIHETSYTNQYQHKEQFHVINLLITIIFLAKCQLNQKSHRLSILTLNDGIHPYNLVYYSISPYGIIKCNKLNGKYDFSCQMSIRSEISLIKHFDPQ